MKLTKAQEQEKQEAINYMRSLFVPILQSGEKPILRTTTKHVSRSGMMRHIDVVFATKEGQIIKLNRCINALGDYKWSKNMQANNADSLRVGGCGMDMGFAVVYSLGYHLFPSEEENKTFKIRGRNGDEIETSGSYLLRQEWL